MANIFNSVPPPIFAAIRAKDTIAGQAADEFKTTPEKDAAQPVTWNNDQGQPVEWRNNQGEPVTFVRQPFNELSTTPPLPPKPVPTGWMNSGDGAQPLPIAVLSGEGALSANAVVVPAVISITALQWIVVQSSPAIKAKIAAVSEILDDIVRYAKGTNLPSDQLVLTDIERNQLIAILETAINILKSPLVEKGLLKSARDSIQRAASGAAEKGAQTAMTNLAMQAVEKLTELFRMIF